MAEGLGLYSVLSYARQQAVTRTGGGLIVCDRTAMLKNLMDKPIKDPVDQMLLNLIRHAMVKALTAHRYVTFVHKTCYGYGKNWLPDALAKSGRKNAAASTRIHVPCPLECGNIRFVKPRWNSNGLLLQVTMEREGAMTTPAHGSLSAGSPGKAALDVDKMD